MDIVFAVCFIILACLVSFLLIKLKVCEGRVAHVESISQHFFDRVSANHKAIHALNKKIATLANYLKVELVSKEAEPPTFIIKEIHE